MTLEELEERKFNEYNNFEKLYFKHYEVLESKFLDTLYFVEFDKKNFKTFSVEYEQLLISIGSEIDIALKHLCKMLGVNNSKYVQYVDTLTNNGINLKKINIYCKEDNQSYIPWNDWKCNGIVTSLSKQKGTFWWRNYQAVKHFRVENDINGIPNYTKANLKTVFYALMSLYSINKLIINKMDEKYEKSYKDINREGYFSPSFGCDSKLFE